MLVRDLAHSIRSLWNSPAFTVTAVATIALGIGASTAVFSVTNAVLLRPFPFEDPDRLMFAFDDRHTRGTRDLTFANATFHDLRNGTKAVFEDLATITTASGFQPQADGNLERISYARITTNFFAVVGASFALGRDFVEADAASLQSEDGEPPRRKAILSYEYWQRRFGGDAGVLGQTTAGVPGSPEIVGVLAPGFEFLFPPHLNMENAPEIWFAVHLPYDDANRNSLNAGRAVGRLRGGVTLERAQAEADAVAASVREQHVIYGTSGFHIRLEPIQQYVVAQSRPTIVALMGAAIFLLLVAYANVANLLLARASLRQSEFALRAALGANPLRLVGLALTEASLLAGLGALLGLGLAVFGIRGLLAMAPADIPRLEAVRIDADVLLFAVAAAISAALVFGVLPALRASRLNLMRVLQVGSRTVAPGGAKVFRNSVVVAQVGLAFVLLIGSGLMVRSFIELQRIDPGYDAENLLTFRLIAPFSRVPEERAGLIRSIRERLAAIPGVASVTAASPFPLTDSLGRVPWGPDTALNDPSQFHAGELHTVLPGYFETLGLSLRQGRVFTEADNVLGQTGVVIDEVLAEMAFPGGSAVGKRLALRGRAGLPVPEIVDVLGVVEHQRSTSLADMGLEQMYILDGSIGHGRVSRWAVRTTGDPASYTAAVRRELVNVDSRLVPLEIETMERLVTLAQSETRFALLLIGVFAMAASTLAAVGIYAVVLTAVRQRTAEIGLRMSLGATRRDIFRLVVGQGLRLSAVGVALGLVAAFGLTHLLASMLVGVETNDPATFIAISALFLLITAVACWVPAHRAAGLDPNIALRQE